MPQLPDHETLRITISESWDNQHSLKQGTLQAGLVLLSPKHNYRHGGVGAVHPFLRYAGKANLTR